MRVKRNFDRIYRTESDPWNIGDATSDRYNLYYAIITSRVSRKKTILDIGCGFGALLSRFKNDFEHLIGVELSDEATLKGKEKYPYIRFVPGSAENLARAVKNGDHYDAIVFSDVIYYLDEAAKNSSLEWIANHLENDGLGLVSAWCPGGQYLEYDELKRLVQKYFGIESEYSLESKHAIFVARKKRHFVAITIDYETWHPIPKGKTINWENDVFRPTEKLLQICDQEQVRLTLMAEMGEYLWLKQNNPQLSQRMEQQWIDAIRCGHDVQVHLHPNWLPELGAHHQDGKWKWDWSKAKCADYPGELTELIGRCKMALETILVPVKPTYRVTSFRAGAYSTQPFKRLHDALVANGIFCDTSVYAGGVSKERGYDYSLAFSDHQPYFANSCDPQLKAPPSEQGIVEIPVFTFQPNERWLLDGKEGRKFAKRLVRFEENVRKMPTSESYRLMKWIRRAMGTIYYYLKPFHKWLNLLLSKPIAHFMTSYGPETLVGHEYFVIIGHSKTDLYFDEIAKNLHKLRETGRFEFVTMSEMATIAKQELASRSRKGRKEEAEYQVKREYQAVLGYVRNEAQSYYLQETIPVDRTRVLDLGCGGGYWSNRISKLYPWMKVIGVDWGVDFIAKARSKFSSERVSFQVEDFAHLSFTEGSFDCVYADNSLEHAYDVDNTLQEVYRVLQQGGVLVAAIPSDARNARKICDNHTWKTAPHEVRMRLENAGFHDIEIHEVDTFRRLGMPPYPPSDDKMMYVRAWKYPHEVSKLQRALDVMHWVYRKLSPEESSQGNDPVEILTKGYAFCWGYVVVLGELLRKEGFSVKWLSMLAKNHPKGRGRERTDSHEVIVVEIDGKEIILDPMANTCIPHSLSEVLTHPELARAKENPDERYVSRGYEMYDTEFWYDRVYKYALRDDYRKRIFFWRNVNRRRFAARKDDQQRIVQGPSTSPYSPEPPRKSF